KAVAEIRDWDYSQPNVLELKMEDLIREPEAVLLNAFSFIGLLEESPGRVRALISKALASARRRSGALVPFASRTLPAEMLVGAVRRNAFELKAGGRAPGVEDVHSHYRKGIAGDWVNHFEPAHKEYFNSMYGDLLERLGYETSSSW